MADTTTKWTADVIYDNLRLHDHWVFKGILAIYKRQTPAEQNSQSTQEDNGVGFSGVDAQIMSSFAQQIERWNAAPKKQFPSPLSAKQMEIARKKILKYAKQLAKIANGEIQ